MEASKVQVVSAITRAQAALEQALHELDRMPGFEPGAVGFHAHALNNYLVVAGGIVELILLEQPSHLTGQVKLWLEDVLHATRMMERTVSHLMRLTPRPTGGESSTGYGLAVARELVEKMGGKIWCESALGQGSRFSFRLPANREDSPGTVTT